MRASSGSRTGSEQGSSESDTLIPSSPGDDTMPAFEKGTEVDAPDQPVKFRKFLYSLKLCKFLLAFAIPASVGCEVACLLLWLKSDWRVQHAGTPEKVAKIAVTVSNAIGVALTVRSSYSPAASFP